MSVPKYSNTEDTVYKEMFENLKGRKTAKCVSDVEADKVLSYDEGSNSLVRRCEFRYQEVH